MGINEMDEDDTTGRAKGGIARAAALIERVHHTMGTELRVTVSTRDTARADAAIAAVFGEFDRLETMMSVWNDASDSTHTQKKSFARNTKQNIKRYFSNKKPKIKKN